MPAVATGADDENVACRAPFQGIVSAVSYQPKATYTGAATNFRRWVLVNRGAAGAGTTVIATVDGVGGVNIAAFGPGNIPVSATYANTVVAANDDITFQSTHVGTGLADPGGELEITFQRAQAQPGAPIGGTTETTPTIP